MDVQRKPRKCYLVVLNQNLQEVVFSLASSSLRNRSRRTSQGNHFGRCQLHQAYLQSETTGLRLLLRAMLRRVKEIEKELFSMMLTSIVQNTTLINN